MVKYYLSFHTIFIMNENVKWMEEFIIYYKNLGVEHFYLYDNEGSSGYYSSNNKNRYDFPISTTSNQDDLNKFNYILSKYGDYITYIKWQPRNYYGQIFYDQDNCIKECINKYGNDNEWIAFLDFDEFIFSVKNINLVEYLKSLNENVSCVKLIQKKFLDRFLTDQVYITQEFRCINNFKIGTEWAPKNIVRCKDFESLENIHRINVKNNIIVPDTDILRFNHYNLNEKQFNWMKSFYNRDFDIDGTDDGMVRYKDLFKTEK